MTTVHKNDLFLRPDAWMTSIIGKDAFHANTGLGQIDQNSLKELGTCFIDVKIDTREAEELQKFQKAGFQLIDTNVQFIKPIQGLNLSFSTQVRHAKASDQEMVRHIAATVFLSNRFHRDPGFTHAISSKIKEEWVGNFFTGKRGNAMLVAEYEQQVAGFILLLHDAAKQETIIDLVGIDTKFQGKGLAKQLIQSSESLFHTEKIRVGTQLSNPASVYLYQHLGFSFESANYSLHLHI